MIRHSHAAIVANGDGVQWMGDVRDVRYVCFSMWCELIFGRRLLWWEVEQKQC